MAYNTIQFEIDQGVARLRLNRPDRLNSFNREMHVEVRDALTIARDNRDIRCVLLAANGRGFCAGQDLSDRAVSSDAAPPDLSASLTEWYNPLIRNLTSMQKPVVCAVNGVAAGAGASIALACDIVLAARSAVFIQAFCKIGLVPDSGGSWSLPHTVGKARAMGLAMLGDKINAEQAERWGMIWQCVDDDKLNAEALSLANHLATQPTRGLAAIKQAINSAIASDLDTQLDLEGRLQGELGRGDDYKEGVSAFMEKRPAKFTGR
jgi:2-(1,2-epoxy-1,2-dihydrophenyl)acetyl-CoA isomerase